MVASLSLSPAPRRQRRAASSFATKFTILACMLIALLCFFGVHAEEEKKENDFGTVIGIDLGTTYSCVA